MYLQITFYLRYLIGSEIDVPAERENSWLIKLIISEKKNESGVPNRSVYNVSDISFFTRYISALYYTASSLATIGFGTIAPNTSAEKIFGVVTMTFGCKWFVL